MVVPMGAWTAVTSRASERQAGLLMLLKAAIATVVAWQVSVLLLDSPTPFYAPMAALLVVDRTMVRSLWASAQRLAAVVVGMSTAWLVGSLVGVHWWSMLPVLFLALLIAQWHRLGDHGIQVPTMVLLSLLTVGGTDADFTILTIAETLLGGVIGVAVNAVVLAPLRIREPRQQVAELSRSVRELLGDISDGLQGDWDAQRARHWYDSSASIAEQVPVAREEISTGRESTRLNPREGLKPVTIDWGGYEKLVEAVRRAEWHVGGIARTLVDAAEDDSGQPTPSETFLARYAGALDEVSAALERFGVDNAHERALVQEHLDNALESMRLLSGEVREARLQNPDAWPAYGSLILLAQRMARELLAHREQAVVPTDSGPIRTPRWR